MGGKKHFQGQSPRIIIHVNLKFFKKNIQGFNYDFYPLDHFKWLSKERNNCTATGIIIIITIP